MANRIFRGNANTQPVTVTATLLADAKAGTLVKVTDAGLAIATDATGRILVLNTQDYAGGTVEDVRKAGDTAEAFEVRKEDKFLVRMASGAYTRGQALTIGADGYLKSAGATDPVFAFFDEANRTLTAGALADVATA